MATAGFAFSLCPYDYEEKEMVGFGYQAQQRDGLEEKCFQAIRSEEYRAFPQKLGLAQHEEEGEPRAVGDVDAVFLYQSSRKESLRVR
jgi:hypothetical protein